MLSIFKKGVIVIKIIILTLIFIHRTIKNGPDYLNTFITYNFVHNYNTRQMSNIYTEKTNLKIGEYSVFVKGYKKYNELPKFIKELPTLKEFKVVGH